MCTKDLGDIINNNWKVYICANPAFLTYGPVGA